MASYFLDSPMHLFTGLEPKERTNIDTLPPVVQKGLG